MMGNGGGLGRGDLAILAANVAALGLVANIGGMKVFEDNDVRIPVAAFAIGTILALLAILIAYASSRRRPSRRRRSTAELLAGLRLREERRREAAVSERGGPARPDRRYRATREAERRSSARLKRMREMERVLERRRTVSLLLMAALVLFGLCIGGALISRDMSVWPRLWLALAAAFAIAAIAGLTALSRLDRRGMAAWGDRLSLGAFTALIVGAVLLLSPTISDGAQILIHRWEPPAAPEAHDDWKDRSPRTGGRTVVVIGQVTSHGSGDAGRGEGRVGEGGEDGQTGSNGELGPEGPRGPAGPPGPTGTSRVFIVPEDSPCTDRCLRDKPADAERCVRCLTEAGGR